MSAGEHHTERIVQVSSDNVQNRLDRQRKALGLNLVKHVHERAVFGRRARVLAASLATEVPRAASVLDIGCGDGTIAMLMRTHNPGMDIRGVEFAPRPQCHVGCLPFDGVTIPYASNSFDVCMFVDVLHHAPDKEGLETLLLEACRVSKRFVLIKDHRSESGFDFKTLQFMDWVGNRPHGVVLPYNYQSSAQWKDFFSRSGLRVLHWRDEIDLYPFPFSALFGRKLHFIALLGKSEYGT